MKFVSVQRISAMLMASLLLLGIATAQDFRIQLSAPPPNQMRLADLWRVTLQNNSGQSRSVFLHGTGEERRDGFVVDAETRVFELAPGMKVVTGQFVQPVKVNRSNNRYRGIVENVGTVPSGEYTICVEIVDSKTREVLAKDCFEQRVEQMSPPVLQTPDNGDIVMDSLPSFTWLPPAPVPADMASKMRYRLKIVEVVGAQTPQQAMLANPAYFERNDIVPPLFIYPFSARKLEDKKKYAWKITAQFNDGFPVGESEIWWFTKSDAVTKSQKKKIDTVNNPISGGILAAGDQNSAGIFETKDNQKATLDYLKNSWEKNGVSKGTVLNDKNFSAEVARKNSDAIDFNRYAAAGIGGASAKISDTKKIGSDESITIGGSRTESIGEKSLSAEYDANKFKLAADGVEKLKKSIGDLAVKKEIDGLLWLWGRNYEGQTGFLAPAWYTDVPVPYDIKNIIQVSCGANHTMILLKDGTVWAWGDNQFGQCANANIREFNYAVPIAGLTNVVQIAAGFATSYALNQNGEVFSWGYNVTGELGIGTLNSHDTAVPVRAIFYGSMGLEKIVRIAARGGHALALSAKGNVFAWGTGYFGELGNGYKQSFTPTPVVVIESSPSSSDRSSYEGFTAKDISSLTSVRATSLKSMTCGDHHNVLVSYDGNTVISWGRNASGQLGDGTTSDTARPARIKLTGIDTVAAGGAHTLAIKSNRALMVWGNDMSGQLGDANTGIMTVPTELASFGQALSITAGASHSMAIKRSGGLWTWGMNNFGQLAISPISDVVLTRKPPLPPTRIALLEK